MTNEDAGFELLIVDQEDVADSLEGYVKLYRTAYEWRVRESDGTDQSLSEANVGAAIYGAATKATPDDTDICGYLDGVTAALKKFTWANLKAALKTYFDSLYSATGHTHGGVYQPVDSDLTVIAGLTPANDDILQRKSGAWINRTIANLKTDLGLGSAAYTESSAYGTAANSPTSDQKAALAGTSGTAPSLSNKYVDNADTRMTNARTPSAHNHAASETTSGTFDAARIPVVVGRSNSVLVVGMATDINAGQYDYVCDGTDDDIQIQAAITALYSAHRGGKVILMPGNYHISAQITVYPWITLEGLNVPFQSNWGQAPSLTYTEVARIFVTATDLAAIWLKATGSSIRNLMFIYPNQDASTSPPIVYPATVRVGYGIDSSKNNVIEWCVFLNSYIAVDASTYHDTLLMQHNIGYCYSRWLIDDQCYDVDWIFHNHINPNPADAFGLAPTGAKATWVNNNMIGFDIGRSDGIRVIDNFVYRPAVGIDIRGGLYSATLRGNYIDESHLACIRVNNNGILDGCEISGGKLKALTGCGITTTGTGYVQDSRIDHVRIIAYKTMAVYLGSTSNNVEIDGCSIAIGDGAALTRGMLLDGSVIGVIGGTIRGLATNTQGIQLGSGHSYVIQGVKFKELSGSACNVGSASSYNVQGNHSWHTTGFSTDIEETEKILKRNTHVATP